MTDQEFEDELIRRLNENASKLGNDFVCRMLGRKLVHSSHRVFSFMLFLLGVDKPIHFVLMDKEGGPLGFQFRPCPSTATAPKAATADRE